MRRLRYFAGILLFLAGAALLAWTVLPEPQATRQVTIGGLPQDAAQTPGLWWERRVVTVSYPAVLRKGETAALRLDAAPAGEVAGAALPFEQYAVWAEAAPDLPILVAPEGTLSQAWTEGESLDFAWQMRGYAPGKYDGRVWLSLRLIPRDGSQETVYPLLAVPVEFEVVSLWGIDVSSLRWIAALLGAASLALVFWRGRKKVPPAIR